MRKFVIAAVSAASALAFAVPASAQWAPPVYNYQPYNYGSHFSYRVFGNQMQSRVERIRNDIRVMQSRRILSLGEARSLDRQANNLQRRIYNASRNGIRVGEARSLERQIRNLEYRVHREATDWNNRYGRNRGR